MSLSCECDCNMDDGWYIPEQDFSSSLCHQKCRSCNCDIQAGTELLAFELWRYDQETDDEICYGYYYHCEACGEIFMNLEALGYCMYTNNHMPTLLREYHELTGFKINRR